MEQPDGEVGPSRQQSTTKPPEFLAGTVLAERYEVIRELGRGSFGQTLLARDRVADRSVALKVLSGPGDLKTYELFEREASVLRTLRHHGVPEVYDQIRVERQGGTSAVLVMEFIDGVPLAQMIAEGPRPDEAALVDVFVALLGVLDYLHSRVPPVLHRDIKPSNIIVRPDGRPVLVDFGSVRSVFHAAGDDGSTIVGTYGYMPYEQYMGKASPASDLFSLAATFLHLITGRPPREFMTAAARLELPESLPCGEPFRTVLSRSLASAPADRYQTAREARAALYGKPETSRPASQAVAPRMVSPVAEGLVAALPPAPREVRGDLAKLGSRLAGSVWQLFNSSSEPRVGRGVTAVFFTLMGIVTCGVLPAIYLASIVPRRRRLKLFLESGIATTATVLTMGPTHLGSGMKFTQVRYQFTVDGTAHRGSDLVLPWLTNLWFVGDLVPALYLPDRNYDSILVPTV